MELLKELQSKYKEETRDANTLYQNIRNLGLQMYLTNSISKELVLELSCSLLKLYELLKEKKDK